MDRTEEASSRPGSLRFLLVFLTVHLLIVATQIWAVFDYDRVASYKLAEPRVLADEGVVQSNRAIGIGSAIVVLPLNVLSLVTVWQRNPLALTVTPMLLGLSMYWPVVFLASRYTYASADVRCVSLQGEDLGICLIMILGSIGASWSLMTNNRIRNDYFRQQQSGTEQGSSFKRD